MSLTSALYRLARLSADVKALKTPASASRRRVRTCAGGASLLQLTLKATAKATAMTGPMKRLALMGRLIFLSSLAEIDLVSMIYACDRGRGCRRTRAGHG